MENTNFVSYSDTPPDIDSETIITKPEDRTIYNGVFNLSPGDTLNLLYKAIDTIVSASDYRYELESVQKILERFLVQNLGVIETLKWKIKLKIPFTKDENLFLINKAEAGMSIC